MEIFNQIVEEKFKMDLEALEQQIKELEQMIKEKKKQKEILTNPKEALKNKIEKTKNLIKEIIYNNNLLEVASDYERIRVYVDKNNVDVKVDLTTKQKEILSPKVPQSTQIVKVNLNSTDM